MTCKCIKFFAFILVFTCLIRCKPHVQNKAYTYVRQGYWYKLLSFTHEKKTSSTGCFAWINAVFKTQNDSVFYTSQHELQDRFFVKLDSTQKNNLLHYAISKVTEEDSLCLLIPAKQLFSQQFKSHVPKFLAHDSVVKINLKIKKIFSPEEFQTLTKTVQNEEMKEIEAFFKSPQAFEAAKDPLGFYWVERPLKEETIGPIDDDIITLSYSGSFLNGRVIDVSREGFQFKYGTPDQLIKGLNYVIAKLKKGQTSKIILPSHLAFGENGSSNGSVPPFTPMLYKINLIDIKTKEVD